ncbi:MAG: ABC transporter permease subunit [Thermoleophilia bacterium]|nr:ABC transporter permease subunit [Thermoleophilia bacterium]
MIIGDVFKELTQHSEQWMPQTIRHAQLSIVAIAFAVTIGIALGAWLTRNERWATAVVSTTNLGRTVPSLAILALVYPFTGTGFLPAVIALVALGIPPVLMATYTGIREVDADIREAALGMGLTNRERLLQAELPVAMPVLLSGVRTAAVQIVASATLAALIGGGGLGELIMAGLTNLRTDLLVTGALLVASLAAITEIACTQLETRALPIGIRLLQASNNQRRELPYRAGSALTGNRWRVVGVVVVMASAVFIGVGSAASHVVANIGMSGPVGAGGPLPIVRIGSKDFTEAVVLGELYAQSLEAQGYRVERHLSLGATAVADSALRGGSIDLYPEYTGTALMAVLKSKLPQVGGGSMKPSEIATAQSKAVYDAVQRGYASRGLSLLGETPFSNGNAIVVSQSVADKYHLKSISDLARVSTKLKFAAVPGFDTREDGLPLLNKSYGIKFGKVTSYDPGLKYQALADGKVDAAYGFETDGQISRLKLVALTDDKHVWPPYHVAPIVSSQFLHKAGVPFSSTLNMVSRMLDADTMRRLNDEVDAGHKDPADVARAFLHKHALDVKGPRPTVKIGSKDFTEQFILGELYAQALEARGFPVERHLNLGATAVADGAVRSGQVDLYPEYTGTSLSAVLKQAPRQGMTDTAVYSSVERGYKKRGLALLGETPFSNGNAIVVSRATAAKYHLTTLSDLVKVAPKLRFAAVPGADTREDGLPLLSKTYGLKFHKVTSYENGIKYQALADGKVDAAYGFETDGQIDRLKLVVLADDKHIWPPYHVAPVVNAKFLGTTGPDFAGTVDAVSSLLDADTMRKLNDQVDTAHNDPADVARRYLRAHGLV